MQILLVNELGANINAKNSVEETPLHIAAYNGKLEMVTFLLENGADIEKQKQIKETIFKVFSHT